MTESEIELFDKKLVLKSTDIKLTASVCNSDFDILAIVLKKNDIALVKCSISNLKPTVKWIPWFDDILKRIQCIAFSPSGSWLLTACSDGSLFLIPTGVFLNFESSQAELDWIGEWSFDDVTKLASPVCPAEGTPSALSWWSRSTTAHYGLLGLNTGLIVAFFIESGEVLFKTKLEEAVILLEICIQLEDSCCVVVTTETGRQWRLLTKDQGEDKSPIMPKRLSALQELKQKSVDAMSNIKLKLSEKSKQNPLLSLECVEGEVFRCSAKWNLGVRLQTVNDVRLTAHSHRMSVMYPANVIAIENFSLGSSTVHKLPQPSSLIALTDFFIIFSTSDKKLIIISQALSLCPSDSNKQIVSIEFNKDSMVQTFQFPKTEKILKVYITSQTNHRCLVVTNYGVYLLKVRDEPSNMIKFMLNGYKIREAEKLSKMLGVDLQGLIREAADAEVTCGRLEEAANLYNLTQGGPVRFAIMLSVQGLVPEVLDLLRSKAISSSKIHLSNIKILAFVHEMLVNYSADSHRQFLSTLLAGGYDEALAVSVLTQAGLCTDLLTLTLRRGLQPVTAVALANVLQHSYALDVSNCPGFWFLISEPSLCEGLIYKPKVAKVHLCYIKSKAKGLSEEVLLRLEKLYNPFRASMAPWINVKYCSQIDLPLQLWVQTYLTVTVHLSAMKRDACFNNEEIPSPVAVEPEPFSPTRHRDFIGAGYSHVAILVSPSLFTWGGSSGGCLGVGPTTTKVLGPTLVDFFNSIGIEVLSVSCGRAHSLALTSNGVYSWGSNRFGQLGVEGVAMTWFPTTVEFFTGRQLLQVTAGQYHSLGVDCEGRVYSWGWGVHGQLGHGHIENVGQPTLVASLRDHDIRLAAAGYAHSLFLDRKGNVWACGSSVFGQLGTGTNNKSSTPQQIYGLPEKISLISTKYFHSLALASSGRVYQWGCSPNILRAAAHAAKRKLRSSEGGAECSEDDFSYLSPTLVDTSHVVGAVRVVSAGAEHSGLLTEQGELYTWGRNLDGQLGNGASVSQRRSQHVLHPSLVSLAIPAQYLACGFNYTVMLDRTGKVWAWGACTHASTSRGALGSLEGEIFSFQNRNRVIKFPYAAACTPSPSILQLPAHSPVPLNKPHPPLLYLDHWLLRMLYAVEYLQPFYDLQSLLETCIELQECRVGSKLARLSGDLGTAVKLQLAAASSLEECKQVVFFYLGLATSPAEMTAVLSSILLFWGESAHNFEDLEQVLEGLWERVGAPLARLLLDPAQGKESLLSFFSTSFSLRLVVALLAFGEANLDLIVPGADSVEDALNAIHLSDNYIDIANT